MIGGERERGEGDKRDCGRSWQEKSDRLIRAALQERPKHHAKSERHARLLAMPITI